MLAVSHLWMEFGMKCLSRMNHLECWVLRNSNRAAVCCCLLITLGQDCTCSQGWSDPSFFSPGTRPWLRQGQTISWIDLHNDCWHAVQAEGLLCLVGLKPVNSVLVCSRQMGMAGPEPPTTVILLKNPLWRSKFHVVIYRPCLCGIWSRVWSLTFVFKVD